MRLMHGNQGYRHAHIANDFKGESDRVRETERCCTQQYGKVCEVGTFTHCDGGVGEGVIPSTVSVRPLPNAQDFISAAVNQTKNKHAIHTIAIHHEFTFDYLVNSQNTHSAK